MSNTMILSLLVASTVVWLAIIHGAVEAVGWWIGT